MSEVRTTMAIWPPGQASGLGGRNVYRGSRRQVFTRGFSILQYTVTYRKRSYGNTVISGYATSKSLLYQLLHCLHCSVRSYKTLPTLSHYPFSQFTRDLFDNSLSLSVVQNIFFSFFFFFFFFFFLLLLSSSMARQPASGPGLFKSPPPDILVRYHAPPSPYISSNEESLLMSSHLGRCLPTSLLPWN